MHQPDVLIIGGGVIGCAIAYALTRQSALRVLLIERGAIGSGASNAAAGVLAIGSSRASRGALFELRRRSAAMFPELAAALQADSTIDPEYAPRGLLELAFTAREENELRDLVRRRSAQGFQAELLDAASAHDLEPSVSGELRAAARFGDDHTINNEHFTAALADAARHRGAEIRLDTPVTACESAAGRVLRVRAAGEWISPGVVVIAAGVWSRDVAALLRVRVPLRAARGEMLVLRPRAGLPRHTIVWDDGYLVPRANGALLVGSTVEYSEIAEVTSNGLDTLLRRARRMMPALTDTAVVRSWAGLRPCPTIRRPIIGPVRGFDNLLLATGHHRNGFLLAPITGQLVAELITQHTTSIPIAPFSYRPR